MKRMVMLLCLPLLVNLSGCALVVAGGAVGATVVAMDGRDVGTQVDDNSLRLRVESHLNDDQTLREQRIQIVAYNGNVLIFGQAESDRIRDQAVRVTRDVNGVNRVYDQLRVGPKATLSERSRDTFLTSRVKAALITDSEFDHSNIKVYSEKGEVFLVGVTTADAAADAIEQVRHMNGVERVIDVLERR
ncbi:BON domain-containing protein [Aliidiomarina sedimenti]|uniref:BON domain-containing protein n=1 Tax=Aliidiomarina sedimenti TaxID=1933879 RepID=A0ABY0C0C2_9GAMM|nr:BON domain-containing protein [Aliidiomarina sedimenti]RUO30579.1 BON domain-containing protein [Aliidiomarina sedimenti]